jgi:hypothetical protein
MTATAQPSAQTGLQPTVVLVHGAFADASSWNGVIERLQRQGGTVVAPATRCAAWPLMPPTWPVWSTSSTAPCCWSATPTAGR